MNRPGQPPRPSRRSGASRSSGYCCSLACTPKTAQRRAADEGELISFESQRENQCEMAGLKWLDVAPQYAIEGRLGDTITNLGSIATVDRMLTAAKSFNGHSLALVRVSFVP